MGTSSEETASTHANLREKARLTVVVGRVDWSDGEQQFSFSTFVSIRG
jgi:hypothetical protein